MLHAIILDSGPLGTATKRRGVPDAEACRRWVADWIKHGVSFHVPAIAYYEVRRELERHGNWAGCSRLDAFCEAVPNRYIPLSDSALRSACGMWAKARNQGTPTADRKELDCDVLIASQAIELGLPESDFVIATVNAGHLSLFCPAASWLELDPHA